MPSEIQLFSGDFLLLIDQKKWVYFLSFKSTNAFIIFTLKYKPVSIIVFFRQIINTLNKQLKIFKITAVYKEIF